jgi:hypothetical protein
MPKIEYSPSDPRRIERLLCPRCGTQMNFSRVEPDEPGFDLRTFQCPKCQYLESFVVKEAPKTASGKLSTMDHIDITQDHPFTINIESDVLGVGRSRWRLCEGGYTRDRSIVSYATKREAEADATKKLHKRIAIWRTGKRPDFPNAHAT